MTIVLKEAARRRITRRRKVESNGKAREYSREERRADMTAMDKAEIARRLALMNEFVAVAREYSQGAALSDAAVSREAIYEGRGA
jgi:hypothetical protein